MGLREFIRSAKYAFTRCIYPERLNIGPKHPGDIGYNICRPEDSIPIGPIT